MKNSFLCPLQIFFDTKFGKSSTIIFFAASMTFIGFHDLNKHIGKGYRNYVSLGQNRYLIVKELHGEVNVNKISQKRRVIRQESKKKTC